MGIFGKKKLDRDEIIAQGLADAEVQAAGAGQDRKDDIFNSGSPKLDMEITKIKAQLESFNEIRKSNSERFSRVSEQLGEIRGMVMDTNKTMSKIEVSATKAIDLVESVQPEKLMIEMRKQEGKGEALKANIESNEAMMRDIMEELKKMRQHMNFYKGIEQVAKLNEEVKTELLDIKKVEATIERHADKAESIFIDMEKKFAEFEKFQRTVDDLSKTFHAIQTDFDKMKLKLSNKAEKKEFGSLMDKFTEFERHTGNILKLLDERSRQMKLELKDTIKKMKQQMKRKHGLDLDERRVRVPRLPEEEKAYIKEKTGSAPQEPETQKPETQEPEPIKPAAPGKKLSMKFVRQDPRIDTLRDLLKQRSIISRKLSDEQEEQEEDSLPSFEDVKPEEGEKNKPEEGDKPDESSKEGKGEAPPEGKYE